MKELLSRIRYCDLEIKSLIALKNKMECNAMSIKTSNSKEKVSGTKNLDCTYSIVNEYIDIESIIHTKVNNLWMIKRRH